MLGSSGCGKSTLLKAIAGLVVPGQGELAVGQGEGNGGVEIGFVFQDPTLLPWRNVLDNIRLPLELRGQPASSQLDAAGQILEMVGLEPEDGLKFPRMLSGGMRMRVSLARALVTEPDVLLLDEPFAALDDMLRQQLNEDMLRIREARGITTLFVTHNVSEAVFLSERVLVMSSTPGRLVDEFVVPFEYPRTASLKAEARFAGLAGDIAQRLREVQP